MGQKVRDKEDRVVLLLADIDKDGLSRLFDHDAVDRQGKGHILVLLDAAVIVGVEICDPAVLVEGVLLDIQAGGVDVGAENVDALFKGLLADAEEDHGLVHPDAVDTVAGLELLLFRDRASQLDISVLFRFRDKEVHALSLGLALVEEIHVVFGKFHAVILRGQIIGVPCIESFHCCSFLGFKGAGRHKSSPALIYVTISGHLSPGHISSGTYSLRSTGLYGIVNDMLSGCHPQLLSSIPRFSRPLRIFFMAAVISASSRVFSRLRKVRL